MNDAEHLNSEDSTDLFALQLKRRKVSSTDEMEIYLSTPAVDAQFVKNGPVVWWKVCKRKN